MENQSTAKSVLYHTKKRTVMHFFAGGLNYMYNKKNANMQETYLHQNGP